MVTNKFIFLSCFAGERFYRLYLAYLKELFRLRSLQVIDHRRWFINDALTSFITHAIRVENDVALLSVDSLAKITINSRFPHMK